MNMEPRPNRCKVGYVLKRYPRYSETFVVNEILALEAEGREIEIFALRPVEETHFQNIISLVRAPVTRIPDKQKLLDDAWRQISALWSELPGAWAKLERYPEATGRDILQAVRLAIEVRARGVGHLHAHFGTVAATITRIAADLADIPWSMTLHAKDIYYDYPEDIHLDLKIRDADAVVTVSDYNRAYLARQHPRRTVLIHNGIRLEDFPWQAPADSLEVLAVGRLIEKKGFHFLIEALRLLSAGGRKVSARIIGSGGMQAELAEQIAASGVAVTLAGPQPQAEVIAAMRRASVLVCPCVVGEDGNRDGMPTVLLEAMALGLPVIASPVTGIPELVRDGESGLLSPEGDAEALAGKIALMLDDPALRLRLSRAARARIEADFDIRDSARHLGRIFDGQRLAVA